MSEDVYLAGGSMTWGQKDESTWGQLAFPSSLPDVLSPAVAGRREL